MRSIKYGAPVNNVFVLGTTSDSSYVDNRLYGRAILQRPRSRGGANVVVIGYDVADALFPSENPDR